MQEMDEEQRFKMELIEKITRVETMLEAHLASDKEIRRQLEKKASKSSVDINRKLIYAILLSIIGLFIRSFGI